MRQLLFILASTIPIGGFCQQLFQDASGKTNLFFSRDPYGWITYNTSDKSGSVGYTRNRADGYDHDGDKVKYNYLYGGDIKVNVKDGLGSLVSGGSFRPGITLSGNAGVFSDNYPGIGNYMSLYLRPSLSYTQYNYIATSAAVIDKIKKVEAGLLLNFNLQFNLDKKTPGIGVGHDPLKRHYLFAGVQSGYTHANNYSDLDDVQLSTIINTAGNATVYKTETAKSGSYVGYNVIPLNIDVGITPRIFQHNYFGFNSYLRTNFLKSKNSTNAGVGIYLADEKKPSNIAGGLAWQFNDVFDVLKKAGGTFERSSLFFYVGYTIGGK